MFCNDGNYEFFLKRYEKYLSSVLDTYAYCLLGNHFHLLVKIRDAKDLTTFGKLSNLLVRAHAPANENDFQTNTRRMYQAPAINIFHIVA